MAGLSILRASVEFLGISVSDSEVGFNVGGGVLHGLSDKLSLFGEAKYSIVSEFDQAIITAGAHYAF